jgi:hypothetical protein
MTDIQTIFDRDPRIVTIRVYDGFVAKAYKWPCPRVAVEYSRDGTKQEVHYDAKRSHGRGPMWVAMSAKGGRLASG